MPGDVPETSCVGCVDVSVGSCYIFNDLSNKVCVWYETGLNIHVFDITTGKKWIKNFDKRYIMQI